MLDYKICTALKYVCETFLYLQFSTFQLHFTDIMWVFCVQVNIAEMVSVFKFYQDVQLLPLKTHDFQLASNFFLRKGYLYRAASINWME